MAGGEVAAILDHCRSSAASALRREFRNIALDSVGWISGMGRKMPPVYLCPDLLGCRNVRHRDGNLQLVCASMGHARPAARSRRTAIVTYVATPDLPSRSRRAFPMAQCSEVTAQTRLPAPASPRLQCRHEQISVTAENRHQLRPISRGSQNLSRQRAVDGVVVACRRCRQFLHHLDRTLDLAEHR